MIRSSTRGHELTEFALCVPIVILIFLVPVQIQRLWMRQFSLEILAGDIARDLGARPGDAALLQSRAAALVGPDTSAAVALRALAAPVAASPRRPRRWDTVEVALRRPADVGFPIPSSYVCRATARELRLAGDAP